MRWRSRKCANIMDGGMRNGIQNIFKLHSDYSPTGDQPQAIEALVKYGRHCGQFSTMRTVQIQHNGERDSSTNSHLNSLKTAKVQ